MSDGSRTLTTAKLNELIISNPISLWPSEVTVAAADHYFVERLINDMAPKPATWLTFDVMHVYIDPTLRRGECYWGKPDPERLGERFKGYIVQPSVRVDA